MIPCMQKNLHHMKNTCFKTGISITNYCSKTRSMGSQPFMWLHLCLCPKILCKQMFSFFFQNWCIFIGHSNVEMLNKQELLGILVSNLPDFRNKFYINLSFKIVFKFSSFVFTQFLYHYNLKLLHCLFDVSYNIVIMI